MAESVLTSSASSVVSFALNSIGTLSWNNLFFLRDVPKKVQLIEAKLRIIESYLQDAENKYQRSHLTTNWLREIKGVAYRAQDVIEKINCLQQHRNGTRGCTRSFTRYFDIPRHLYSLHKIGEEIDKINGFIPEIIEMTNNLNSVHFGESGSMADQINDQWDPKTTVHISEEDEVVGFESEITKIVNELLDPANEQLSVVSILGMGGIGKSTLARKIFNHSDVNKNFNRKIWIIISQQYNVLSLYKGILKFVSPDKRNEDLENLSLEEMREKISVSLKEEKYLIVIDDIWTIKSWNDINPHNSTFPNTNNGSRIVLTTRNFDVGKYPKIRIFVHKLSVLDDEKSWELLTKKSFPSYVMVSDLDRKQLEYFRPQLVKKCKGLPLALIVLGGYLSKHLNYQTWSRMSEDVDWNEAADEINISQILALSYLDLPNNLKSIFLYIVAFPEDENIKTNDLIKLWIAEGFIPSHQKYKLDTVARRYLDQLYERGLIQIVRENRTHGRISRIRIHDVLRDWGLERAKKEGFFDVIRSSNQATFSDSYRVALYGDCDEHVTTSMSHLRSFLGFELQTTKVYLRNSSSLRVVRYVEEWKFGKGPSKLPKYMKHMLLLRYLYLLNCGKVFFPSSIGQIYNLETLQCIESEIWSLPSSLWKISTLRHVRLEEIYCNWNGPKKGFGKNIQTLIIHESQGIEFRNTTMCLMYTRMDGVVAALEDMKQIVHLRLYPAGWFLCGNVLSVLAGHRHVEVLQLMRPIKGLMRIPDATVFPPNILKLDLDCSDLVEDPMLVLEKLHKLVVLKLRGVNSKIKSMRCTVGGFPQLKYLILRYFYDLEEWKVDAGAMPNLHHLKLMRCKHLKIFSDGLMEHQKLQLLEMGDVPHLYEVDYSRLRNRGCKVVLVKDSWHDALSRWY